MVKSRFSTADVSAGVACLKGIEGFRITNLYDVNAKVRITKTWF